MTTAVSDNFYAVDFDFYCYCSLLNESVIIHFHECGMLSAAGRNHSARLLCVFLCSQNLDPRERLFTLLKERMEGKVEHSDKVQ
jgi:hypothetical protein